MENKWVETETVGEEKKRTVRKVKHSDNQYYVSNKSREVYRNHNKLEL